MNTITLTMQPQAGQQPVLGTDATVTVTAPNAPFLVQGDPYTVQISAPSCVGHYTSIAVEMPGDVPKFAGVLSSGGMLSFTSSYGGSLASLAIAPGMVILTPYYATGPALGGAFLCSFLPAPAPPPAPLPGDAVFEAAVQASWSTHVPVVNVFDPSVWQEGLSYQSQAPVSGSLARISVGLPWGAWSGITLTSAAAQTIAALIGGSVQDEPPAQADYAVFYSDIYAVAGSLPSVPYIYAQVPIGPNGAMVEAKANAGVLANAQLYRPAPGGIHAAILSAFTAL